MPTSFACPQCRTVLKPKADVPAGKKVKCPKCANVFAAPAAEAKATAAVRSGKPPAAATSARQSAPAKDEKDDRDERRARKRSKKRKKKQQSNMPLLLAVGGGGGALVVVFLILGFAWPGFLVSQKTKKAAPAAAQPAVAKADDLPKGTGEENLLNFIPEFCNLVVSIDVNLIDHHEQLKALWQKLIVISQGVPNSPPKLAEIMANVEEIRVGMVVAPGTLPGQEPLVTVIRTKSAYQSQIMRELMEAKETSEQLKGKTCYRLKDDPTQPGHARVMHMPNDRVLVVAEAPNEKLEKALDYASAPPVGKTSARKAFLDLALMLSPEIQQAMANPPPDTPPPLKEAAGLSNKVRGVSLGVEVLQDGKLAIRAFALCASEADGQQLKQALDEYWEKTGKPALTAAKALAPPDLAGLMDEAIEGLSIKVEGAMVTVETALSDKSFQAVLSFLQAQSEQFASLLRAGGPSDPTMQPRPAQKTPGGRPARTPGGRRPGGPPPGGRPPRG